MQEVIYNYYTDHYGGRVIPENEFSYVIKKAEIYLHMFTFDQLEGHPYDNIVKNCLCDMAETIYKVEKLYGITECYLMNTGLLYLGVE